AECFKAFVEGRSGVKLLFTFDKTRFRVQHAYEIDDRGFPPNERAARASEWLVEVVVAALAQAHLLNAPARTINVLVGTGLRELRSVELWSKGQHVPDLEHLDFGARLRAEIASVGEVLTLSNACSASNCALALAEDVLRLGDAEVLVV